MQAEKAISEREGQVLLKDTLLKADHFPGCQNKSLVPFFEDAPNFRQIPELPIYGVAIPTISGLRIVMGVLQAKTRKVLWHNLREEPLLYINGHPFVIRDADKPFANLEYTGINRQRVEDMEERLKQDVIAERRRYDGRVLLSGENNDAAVVQYWEEVKEDAIQTPQDVFRQLVEEDGYNVDYLRVPVTDEKAPKEIDCDLLIQRCWEPGEDTSLVFNCQMGRGRTTTGMIIAALLNLRRRGFFPQKGTVANAPKWFCPKEDDHTSDKSSLKNGNYTAVRSLLRIFEFGVSAKSVLDRIIDAADHMQNLREAIYMYRERLCQEQNERKRNSCLHAALEYLERYCVLIAFAAYVEHPKFNPKSSKTLTFEAFMSERPEFRSVLQRLLRRSPLSALGLHVSAVNEETTRVTSGSVEENVASDVVRRRSGKVLGQHTILKEDQFPGIEVKNVRQLIAGAPNFRGVPNFPVYGVGVPTVDGIRSVLTEIGAGPGGERTKIPALWFNWREEPLVYINGSPFVLREDQRPFKNLKEYTNIDRIHLEKMEERLRQDILQEAQQHEGLFLVAREAPSLSNSKGILEDKWEPITTDNSVQTPASVYKMLKHEGFAVEYHRLPLTDDRTPHASDVDKILSCIRGDERPAIVFNCQNGMGRTTVGMIIGCLFYTQQQNSSNSNNDDNDIYNSTKLIIRSGSVASADSTGEDGSVYSTEDSDVQPFVEKGLLAVRRLTHLLENGSSAKRLVDFCADLCFLLVDIRTEIGQFRKGHHRPEILHRNASYDRSVSYLHRYCFLIATASYLTRSNREQEITFKNWIANRGDIKTALSFILQNPTSALKVISPKTHSTDMHSAENAITAEEEQEFLSQRVYRVLNYHSILKGGRSTMHETAYRNTPDLKRVRNKHVYTIGDPSVESLRKLLDQIQSDPSSPKHVILRDIREELVVYIGGHPYRRRDLERPISSLYHAGVAAGNLEVMEETLREDVKNEAKMHNGQILVHHELPRAGTSDEKAMRRDRCHEDVTQGTDKTEPSVIPIKYEVNIEDKIDSGIYTPKDVYETLSKEGYALTYARVPLSRARTPQASDLDRLKQAVGDNDNVAYVVIARASTGTSARLAAAFFSLVHISVRQLPRRRSISVRSGSKHALGEYRSITHLCRALPDGHACKTAVDNAIDDCARIGSLREDVFSCLLAKDTHPRTLQLGLHYLQRYFFLIAYQCYRGQNQGGSFEDWMTQRKELCHLLSTIELD